MPRNRWEAKARATSRLLDAPRSPSRLFATYALASLVPIVVIGLVLAQSLRTEARSRGISEGRAEAQLLAVSAIEPILTTNSLNDGVTATQKAALNKVVHEAIRKGDVLRLRIRDLNGDVVYSDDGSGFKETPEVEAMDAARGATIAQLTRMNDDPDDSGPVGAPAVEVYLPLRMGNPSARVGVLETYLPYGPISADISSGLSILFRILALGLAALYLVLLAISTSVTRRLRRQAMANAHLAEHDILTGLPNRALFSRRVDDAIEGARHGKSAVIGIIDLDRFKEINDTLGHHNGDDLLRVLARRLSNVIGSSGTVARLGGDEFGIVLDDALDPAGTLGGLRRAMHKEVDVASLPLSVEASIGYAKVLEDGDSGEMLLQRADVAMYAAKERHVGVVRYNATLDHYDAANLALVAALRHGIEADELVLHYQPVAQLASGAVDAVEALVRWEHPTFGLLMPDRFLPLAEQTDLIEDLTRWVLDRALSDIARLPGNLSVAVNISARSLSRFDFADQVIEALRRSGVAPSRLLLEVTETALLTDPGRAATVLGAIVHQGVRIGIDDFGVGQTSLGYLSRLPVHELKIDRSFVSDMLDDPAHGAIVRSIVELGHNLSLRVVGEGVETALVKSALSSVGCDDIQGYHLSRPMPIAALGTWLGIDAAHALAG